MQVILLGADSPIGLAVVRELGQHGVRVHAIGWDSRSVGLYSRYAATSHIRETNTEALIQQLETLGQEYDCPHLMTVGEADIAWLHEHIEAFKFIKPIIPENESFQAALDKTLTSQLAKIIGIRTARSWHVKSLQQLDDISDELTYPLVLKWANPLRISHSLEELGIDIEKYHYIYAFDELKTYLSRLDIVGEFPIIQEHIPGVGLGQMIFMHKGKSILNFQHIREAEWQPEGGISAVCRSLPIDEHQELMKNSIKLLQALNWQGPAMVEYRYDEATGNTCLMEVNGRFWGSQPLAYHAGAYFAWLWYQTGTGQVVHQQASYQENLRCRYFIPEIKRLVRILFFKHEIQNKSLAFSRRREIVRFIKYYFGLKTHYFIWSFDDPKPFFADVLGIIKKVLPKALFKFNKPSKQGTLRSIASKY